MRDFFAVKSGIAYPTIAGIWEVDSLSLGQLGFFNQDGTLISGSSPSVTGDFVSINLMKTNGVNKQSIPIPSGLMKYTKTAYSAPVKAVKYLGSDTSGGAGSYTLNLPSSISVGDIVGVTVLDRTKPFENTSRMKTYTFNVATGDTLTGTGSSNIISKLVALINADSNSVVTATALTDGSSNNDGIKFEAKTAGNDFDIARVEGVLENADIVEYKVVNGTYDASSTNAVANSAGAGTYAQMLKLEKDSSTRDGNVDPYNKGNNPLMYTVGSQVENTTYVQYTLRFETIHEGSVMKDGGYNNVIHLAIPSGNTALISALDSILAQI